jgi:hypothetical protein
VALRREDVDLDLMTVNVRGTTTRVPGVGLVTTLPRPFSHGVLGRRSALLPGVGIGWLLVSGGALARFALSSDSRYTSAFLRREIQDGRRGIRRLARILSSFTTSSVAKTTSQ